LGAGEGKKKMRHPGATLNEKGGQRACLGARRVRDLPGWGGGVHVQREGYGRGHKIRGELAKKRVGNGQPIRILHKNGERSRKLVTVDQKIDRVERSLNKRWEERGTKKIGGNREKSSG